jgi:D-alanine-D-alanine ligase
MGNQERICVNVHLSDVYLSVGDMRSQFAAQTVPAGETASTRSHRALMVELLTRQMLERVRVAVVHGGDKSIAGAVIKPSRNPRSWKSYEAVARDITAALKRLGCRYVEVMPDDMRMPHRLAEQRIRFAWLNTGGVQGQNAIAHASSMLEMLGIAYIGHDPLTAAALDNKFFFKRQLASMGLPTSPFMVWGMGGDVDDPAREPRFQQVFKGWNDGFIVKPITGRASLHVHWVERANDIRAVAAEVCAITQNPVLIEGYLPGKEYCIAVCGPIIAKRGRIEELPGPFSFAAVERVLGESERVFTSMDKMPITKERMRPLDPARDGLEIDTLEELATRLYGEFPLSTLVRLDVRADARGRLHVLEANPKPDLKAAEGTTVSLIEAGLERYGMSYDDLILAIFANRTAQLLDDGAGITEALERLLDR